MSDRQHFKLAPSEFAYLWEECPRCYYEARHGLGRRPDTPFPGIFNRIEGAVCEHFDGRSPEAMAPQLPGGRLICRQRSISSAPIKVPGHEPTVSVAGRLDALAHFNTGGFGVVDFKVCAHSDDLTGRYQRQLWAYAHALEHPMRGDLPLQVSHLGLFVFESRTVADLTFQEHNWLLLHMAPQWCPIERDEGAFLRFLSGVLDVLELPEPPPPDPSCKFCAYRARGQG
jgi:hypothetical protein